MMLSIKAGTAGARLTGYDKSVGFGHSRSIRSRYARPQVPQPAAMRVVLIGEFARPFLALYF